MKNIITIWKKPIFASALFILISLSGWIITPPEPITAAGIKFIMVFIAAIVLWAISTDSWANMIILLMIPFTGVVDIAGIFAGSFGTDTIMFMLVMFVLSSFLEDSGALTYLNSALLSMKLLKGHPWRIIFTIFLSSFLMSTFSHLIVGTMVGWSIVYNVAAMLGYKKNDKFTVVMAFGIGVMGVLALGAVPWANNALIVLGAYTISTGVAIDYLHYMTYTFSFVILSILGFMLLCKFVFRLDVSKLQNIDISAINKDSKQLTAQVVIGLAVLITLIVLMLLPSILPAENLLVILLNKFGMTLRVFIIMFILSLIYVDGKKFFDFAEYGSKSIPWSMMLMSIVIMTFTGYLNSPTVGLSDFISENIAPIFSGQPKILFILLVFGLTVICTNFLVNIVVAPMFIFTALPIATSLGIDHNLIVYLLTLGATIAFLLPSSSMGGMLMYANQEVFKAADIFKYGIPTILLLSFIAVILAFVLI